MIPHCARCDCTAVPMVTYRLESLSGREWNLSYCWDHALDEPLIPVEALGFRVVGVRRLSLSESVRDA